MASKVAEEINRYIGTLKDLQRSLADTSVVASRVMIHRLAEDMMEQGEMMKSIGALLVLIHIPRQ